MINLLKLFISVFIPKFILIASIIYLLFIVFIFFRCFVKKENINDFISEKEKLFFFLSITYTLTMIII